MRRWPWTRQTQHGLLSVAVLLSLFVTFLTVQQCEATSDDQVPPSEQDHFKLAATDQPAGDEDVATSSLSSPISYSPTSSELSKVEAELAAEEDSVAGGTSYSSPSAEETSYELTDYEDDTRQEERWKFNPLHHLMKKKKKKKKNPLLTFTTRTETSTVTSTSTVSTVGLCAKLVNVTGACRLRRGLWVEEPIVMSFDDDMDVIDGQLLPSATFSIETTALPDVVSSEPSSKTNGEQANPSTAAPDETTKESDSKDTKGLKESGRYLSGSVIQPSTSSSTEEEGVDEGADGGKASSGTGGRLYFKQILAIKDAIKTVKDRLKFHLITVITTTVTTSTATSTFYTTASTKTFFIQLCTPSPFPFNICSGKK